MLDNNQKKFLQLKWQDSFGKDCSYFFESGKLLGIRVTDEGFNYMNWKKFFYGLARPVLSLNIQIEQKNISYDHFSNCIKTIVPRPVPRFAEELLVSEVVPFLQSINLNPLKIEHPIIMTAAKEKWSSLPIQKKIILQILSGLDAQAKIHFIFFERIHLNKQQAQMVYDVLKFMSAKNNLSFIVLGDPMTLPDIHWVPLLKAPVLNTKFNELIEVDEDSDEDAA